MPRPPLAVRFFKTMISTIIAMSAITLSAKGKASQIAFSLKNIVSVVTKAGMSKNGLVSVKVPLGQACRLPENKVRKPEQGR